MYAIKTTRRTLAGLLLAGVGFAANAEVYLPDGHAWAESSEREQIAYLLGVSNALSVGYVSDEKRVPGNPDTFTHRAVRGLQGTTIEQAVGTVDAWYEANPDRLDTPVLEVLWEQIGKPRLDGAE